MEVLNQYIHDLGVGIKEGYGEKYSRFYHKIEITSQCRSTKKNGECQAIGKSTGGLSTKIHATCDALGSPTGFHLTAGEMHDLDGADELLRCIQAHALLADKAYYAEERVLQKLDGRKITPVIPARSNFKQPREYDKHLYKARHLIENFFQKLKQYRAIATRYDKTAQNFLAAIYLASCVILLH